MKVLIVYPPFCPPTALPFAPAYLKAFLQDNSKSVIRCLDLNAKLHNLKFPAHKKSIQGSKAKTTLEYAKALQSFEDEARPYYTTQNKNITNGQDPELLAPLLDLILNEKPDIVAFSIVYSSQCFYATALARSIKANNIPCVAGGPSVHELMEKDATILQDEVRFLEFINKTAGDETKIAHDTINTKTVPDFSDFPREDYFSREIIIPLKTSSCCYYKQCAFCTHFANVPYYEIPIQQIIETIKQSKASRFFIIDDMIPAKRLLELAKAFKPLNIVWWCQLKPTKDFLGHFKELFDSGLVSIAWGVESANQSLLDKINKGTDVNDIKMVIQESAKASIKNTVYILFGFPGETRESFMDTINFLKENQGSIFMVSPSIFGLQKGSKVYSAPQEFGITKVNLDHRSFLGDRITYEVSSGLSQDQAKRLRSRFSKTINKINKAPSVFKDYKEQVLAID